MFIELIGLFWRACAVGLYSPVENGARKLFIGWTEMRKRIIYQQPDAS